MEDNHEQQETTAIERLEMASVKLQHDLAQQDIFEDMFSARPSSRMLSTELIVLKLRRLAVTIRMDGNRNHHRGHVHIDYKTDIRGASFAIDTGERLAGRSTPYDAKISAWILKNQKDLIAVWNGMRATGYDHTTVAKLNGTEF